MKKNNEGEMEPEYKEGLFIGDNLSDGSYIIYNHLAITVKTHNVSNGDEIRIVGFEIEQKSIKTQEGTGYDDSEFAPKQYIKLANGEYDPLENGLTFSYSI